jgi:hypothetical protein
MTQLVQTFGSADASVYTFGSELVVVTVNQATTVDMLRASVAAGRKLSARRGAPVGALTIIETGITVPDAELRKELTRTVEVSRAYTACAAQVLRGHGFWLSAVRSLLTAITLLSPGDLPRRVFEETPPAARWMARTLLQEQAWAEQLIAALASVSRPTTTEFRAAE